MNPTRKRVAELHAVITPAGQPGQYPQTNGVLDLSGKLPAEKQYHSTLAQWQVQFSPIGFSCFSGPRKAMVRLLMSSNRSSSMKCPRTNAEMAELSVGGVTVNVSIGCGGIWFANFKLKKTEASDPSQRGKLIELSQQYLKKDIDQEGRLRCPVDPEITLLRRFFSFKKEIEIDECGMCGGIWLDPGEFEKILELYHSPEALEAAKKREQAQQAVRQIREDIRQMKEKKRAEAARQYSSDSMLIGMFTGLSIF